MRKDFFLGFPSQFNLNLEGVIVRDDKKRSIHLKYFLQITVVPLNIIFPYSRLNLGRNRAPPASMKSDIYEKRVEDLSPEEIFSFAASVETT